MKKANSGILILGTLFFPLLCTALLWKRPPSLTLTGVVTSGLRRVSVARRNSPENLHWMKKYDAFLYRVVLLVTTLTCTKISFPWLLLSLMPSLFQLNTQYLYQSTWFMKLRAQRSSKVSSVTCVSPAATSELSMVSLGFGAALSCQRLRGMCSRSQWKGKETRFSFSKNAAPSTEFTAQLHLKFSPRTLWP